MYRKTHTKRGAVSFRILSIFCALAFAASGFFMLSLRTDSCSYAYTVGQLPAATEILKLTPAFTPATLRGISVDPMNPLTMEFILDEGSRPLEGEALKAEAEKLSRYFLAALTIPERDFWVNLSVFEQTKVISDELAATEMGRDLLAEDYILKQLLASFMHPDSETGKRFWKRAYARADELFGTTSIPIDTFNKIWIVPAKAVVQENGREAVIAQSSLKVMLDGDYRAFKNSMISADASGLPQTDAIRMQREAALIVQEEIIPLIEKEVNEGRHFANLRQIFHSLILAAWYKQKLVNSIITQAYADKGKVTGIDLSDPRVKQQIYEKYARAYKGGMYDVVKDEYDKVNRRTVLRRYTSGGISLSMSGVTSYAQPGVDLGASSPLITTELIPPGDILTAMPLGTATLVPGVPVQANSALTFDTIAPTQPLFADALATGIRVQVSMRPLSSVGEPLSTSASSAIAQDLGAVAWEIDNLARQLPPTMELQTGVLKSQFIRLQSTPISEMGPVIAALDTTLGMISAQPLPATVMPQAVTALREQVVSIGSGLDIQVPEFGEVTAQITHPSDVLVSYRDGAGPGQGRIMVAVNDGSGAQMLGEQAFSMPGADLGVAVTNAIPNAIMTVFENSGMDTGRISTVSFIETPGVTNIVTAPQIQSSLGAAGLSNVGTQVLSPQLVSPQQAFNPAPLLPALGSIVTNIDELASQLPPTMELETRVLKSQMVQLQSTPIGEMGPVIAALDTTLNMLQPVGAALMIEDVTVLRKQIVSIGDQLNVPIGGTPQINQASDLLVSFRKVALPGEGLLMVAVNDGRGAQLLGEHTFTIPSGATGADLATAVTNAIPQAISTISGNLAMDTSLINTVNFIESPGVTGIVAAPQLQDSLVDAGLSTMNAVVLPAGPGSAAAFTPAPIISSVSSPLQQRVEAFSNTLNDIANQLPATMMDTQLQLEALAGQLKTTELGLATVLSAGPGVIGNMLPAFETAVPEFVPVLTGVQAGLVGLQQEGKVPELPAFVTQLPGTPNIASTITPGLTDGQLTLTTSLVSADTGLLSTQSMQVPLAATAELTTNAVLEQIGTMVPELSGKVGLEAADIGKMQMSVADSVAEKVKFSQPQMTTALSQQGLNTVTEIVSIEDIQDSMLPASEAVGGIDLDIGALLETMGDGAVPVFSNVYFDLSRFAGFAAEVEVNPPAPSAATAIRP